MDKDSLWPHFDLRLSSVYPRIDQTSISKEDPYPLASSSYTNIPCQIVRLQICPRNWPVGSRITLYNLVLGDLRFPGLRPVTDRLLPLRRDVAPLQGGNRGPSSGESFHFVFLEEEFQIFKSKFLFSGAGMPWKTTTGVGRRRRNDPDNVQEKMGAGIVFIKCQQGDETDKLHKKQWALAFSYFLSVSDVVTRNIHKAF